VKKGTLTQEFLDLQRERDVLMDPWLQSGGAAEALPSDVIFACAYDVYYVVDTCEQAAFFRRTVSHDELWIADGLDSSALEAIASGDAIASEITPEDTITLGRVAVAPKEGEQIGACAKLLTELFWARIGFDWPSRFLKGGVINEREFRRVVGKIKNELAHNTNEARKKEAEIIKVARELGLAPRPTGTGPDHWQATCPESNHPLYISAAENSFGCGWCKRKGGPDELRAFVRERQESSDQ
jgi:hypothetical protein